MYAASHHYDDVWIQIHPGTSWDHLCMIWIKCAGGWTVEETPSVIFEGRRVELGLEFNWVCTQLIYVTSAKCMAIVYLVVLLSLPGMTHSINSNITVYDTVFLM